MELLNIDCLGKRLRLEGSLAGWQQLFWGNHLVSERPASADNEGVHAHIFQVRLVPEATTAQVEIPQAQELTIALETNLQWQPFAIAYRLLINNEVVNAGSRNTRDIEQQVPEIKQGATRKVSLIGFASLGFKLLKSAKLLKVILAAGSLAAYSWLFSFKFAVALLLCLIIHEYGHIRAMKYFGMKTKGIYLIPFVGGLALTEDKINTRWQDVVISIMGPCFGLLLSFGLLIAYLLTDNMLFAGLANFNALLNLINLLPIMPLDGGHILKSICFSANNRLALVLLTLGSALGILACYFLHLTFLAFFLFLGCIEIAAEWRLRHQSALLPLDRYGQIFSGIWYLLVIVGFVGIMWYFASSGDELLSTPMKILQS
ncbi:MAG: site-2 protease family protein [Undibacterium sp.]|nr:site-2 protease family protein [Undibacterium sp.]